MWSRWCRSLPVVCLLCSACAFSTQSGRRRYFPKTRIGMAKDSEGRYLPDGLTEQEWAGIRLREIRERQQKDYGAWGPRFKKQKAPFWANKALWGNSPVQSQSQPAAMSQLKIGAPKSSDILESSRAFIDATRTWLANSLGCDGFQMVSPATRRLLIAIRFDLLFVALTGAIASMSIGQQQGLLLVARAAWQKHRSIFWTTPVLFARLFVATIVARIYVTADSDEESSSSSSVVRVPDSWLTSRKEAPLVGPSSLSGSGRPLMFDRATASWTFGDGESIGGSNNSINLRRRLGWRGRSSSSGGGGGGGYGGRSSSNNIGDTSTDLTTRVTSTIASVSRLIFVSALASGASIALLVLLQSAFINRSATVLGGVRHRFVCVVRALMGKYD